MSIQYDNYLIEHKNNVAEAFKWIQENLSEVLIPGINYEHNICWAHDASKDRPDEYDAYDDYFYGGNRSYAVCNEFNYAWLNHIHRNPHHWQYWILVNDDAKEGTVALDMPHAYIIEMICDWWSFSWKTGNLHEVFEWYEAHKEHMVLSDKTRKTVENVLTKIKSVLEEE